MNLSDMSIFYSEVIRKTVTPEFKAQTAAMVHINPIISFMLYAFVAKLAL